jgi:hypothetical protein
LAFRTCPHARVLATYHYTSVFPNWKPEPASYVLQLGGSAMNVYFVRKALSRREILLRGAALVLIVMPILMTRATLAVAREPTDQPNDVAAYQSCTGQAYPVQYGQPMPPPPPYPGTLDYAQRNRLQSQLNYAEAQYHRARAVGDREAARHWKKDIKHLRRELYGARHAEGTGYGSHACLNYREPSYVPPASAYAPPPQEYGTPEYGAPGHGYVQPYPAMPPYGYNGATQGPYPPAGYAPSANLAAGTPYGALVRIDDS